MGTVILPQEHLWELDEGDRPPRRYPRLLDRGVRQRAVASNFAGELLRLEIRTIAHDGVQVAEYDEIARGSK